MGRLSCHHASEVCLEEQAMQIDEAALSATRAEADKFLVPAPSLPCGSGPATPCQRVTCERPFVIELCCGTALLSSLAQEAGYAVLPIDWGHSKHKPCVRALRMDLRQPSTWAFLRHVCETRPIAWIHVAPPCGTASRAREIGHGPRPLRSMQHVMGLPDLDPVSQERVNSANMIYAETASFCSWLLQSFPAVPFSVENPLHSYMWQLPAFEGLKERLQLAPSARKPQPFSPTMQRFIPCQALALDALFTKNGADANPVMLRLKRPLTRASSVSALWPALTQLVTLVASCLLVPSPALYMQLVLQPSHSRVAEGARLFFRRLLIP